MNRTIRSCVAASVIAGGLVAAASVQPAAAATVLEYSYTGEVQTFVVPPAVIKLQVVAEAGNGWNAFNNEDGALGAKVSATVSVTPGVEIGIYVGGAGTGTTGGFNGGGSVQEGGFAGGGGGATDMRLNGVALSDRIVVAGGGGGARSSSQSLGGVGGTPVGTDGEDAENGSCNYAGGKGATQQGPGAGGQLSGTCSEGWLSGEPGILGAGGDGGAEYGAGGGGGYYGGGGGAGSNLGSGAGGGGGSSYVEQSAINTEYELKSAQSPGSGSLTITYSPAPVVTFDANGGSGSMNEQIDDAPTGLTANAFSRNGYTFAGWNTAADGTGTGYPNEAEFPFTESATLYAQWTQSQVEEPPSGSGPSTPQTKPKGINVKVAQGAARKQKVVTRWKSVPVAEYYEIRLTTKRGKKYKAWKSVTPTRFATRLSEGTYRVQVRAANDAGPGPANTKRFRVR